MKCPECKSEHIRTFSHFNEETDRWDWMRGCNECTWEARDEQEEQLHPEFYQRMAHSPAKINSQNIKL